VDAAMPFRGAYAAMAPKPPYTAEQIMGTILDRGLDHHWSLGYGHYLEDLRMLNHWLGANEVPVSNRGGGCGLSC
ncbi:MAG: fucose isomerase, partial [Planctomycetota bacterium]